MHVTKYTDYATHLVDIIKIMRFGFDDFKEKDRSWN